MALSIAEGPHPGHASGSKPKLRAINWAHVEPPWRYVRFSGVGGHALDASHATGLNQGGRVVRSPLDQLGPGADRR